ncbi:hypothetical protein SAMN04489867_2935 [Pedococcus dokdonensis]|uniref:Hpt domain-containing protein n=1 Tax=Pedococcus dokdonensis TaxID=443156 RepID=A0A1H0TR42_9MICO|nr:hypothetical protein [Pedococcus dokdonensis]SDP56311.1 hypothetical protein SAMN04489867_2935 [Pedococcus dokdonensis]
MADLVDPRVLAALAAELQDPAAAVTIARLYRENLERRVARLDTACGQEDLETAMDVTLSLKVTSATVGALALRSCAQRVEPSLAAGDWVSARSAAAAVRAATPATLGAIDALLGGPLLGAPLDRAPLAG